MGETTDRLLTLASRVAKDPAARELDLLLSTGEGVSAPLVSMALNELGVPAVSLLGFQAGIQTDRRHAKARIVGLTPARIERELAAGRVVVVAGFQGIGEEMEVTTLGRGGSDTTAVAIAAALKARACEILTDVRGIYTAGRRPAGRANPPGDRQGYRCAHRPGRKRTGQGRRGRQWNPWPSRGGSDDVPYARRPQDQHRDDLDLRNPDHLHHQGRSAQRRGG